MRFIEMLPGLLTTAGQVYVASRRVPALAQKPRQAARRRKTKQEDLVMKKSTLIAIIAGLSAIAGALGAMFLYLRRREAELDEYEHLLFSEDFGQHVPSEEDFEEEEE